MRVRHAVGGDFHAVGGQFAQFRNVQQRLAAVADALIPPVRLPDAARHHEDGRRRPVLGEMG